MAEFDRDGLVHHSLPIGGNMIDDKSHNGEITDLQRLLIEMRLLEWETKSKEGVWGRETDEAVRSGYARLGWAHDVDEKWISNAAMAALCAHWAQVAQSSAAPTAGCGCCCPCATGPGWAGGGNMASHPGWAGGGNMASHPGWAGGGNMASHPGWVR